MNNSDEKEKTIYFTDGSTIKECRTVTVEIPGNNEKDHDKQKNYTDHMTSVRYNWF